MYNDSYSLFQIMLFELEHGILSSLVALLVSLPALYLISTIFRTGSSGLSWASSPSGKRSGYTRAVTFMLLLSLSAGLVAHVLEDLWLSWF